jgi:hypothetical protein
MDTALDEQIQRRLADQDVKKRDLLSVFDDVPVVRRIAALIREYFADKDKADTQKKAGRAFRDSGYRPTVMRRITQRRAASW